MSGDGRNGAKSTPQEQFWGANWTQSRALQAHLGGCANRPPRRGTRHAKLRCVLERRMAPGGRNFNTWRHSRNNPNKD
eukprot:scaffold3065_cov389-Prasinococcus_capsulatus_cf.AAC.10